MSITAAVDRAFSTDKIRPGIYVPIKDTVTSFKEILEGNADTLPEQAFFLAGTIDDVRKNAERINA